MRIIKEKTLFDYCKASEHRKAEGSLKSWIYEVRFSTWHTASELKAKFANASIITSKRVVFNIKGNDYRLIVDIEYRLKIVFVVWFGTHKAYDKIDIKKIRYED